MAACSSASLVPAKSAKKYGPKCRYRHFGPYADRLVMPRVVGEYSAEQPLRRRWWPVDRHNLAEVRAS
jgi:hypothetical protein